ncbi:hypothetical protein [uncultured Tateyamaria sp.]|uniref:hypothetical protein n=1 Tax=uncultured Tateyamaria sp. TaxID=455651 RepID=UPI00261B63FF|nr:hypothetical protein [uncultured Tateyamaria sp.]
MLARHAAKTCTSIAAWMTASQYLGHEDVTMAVRHDGPIDREEQRRLVTGPDGVNQQ